MAGMPEAWRDMLNGLTMLARAPSNDSPFHCEHDELTVMADPDQFTAEELIQLSAWGFEADLDDGTFTSVRFGSA